MRRPKRAQRHVFSTRSAAGWADRRDDARGRVRGAAAPAGVAVAGAAASPARLHALALRRGRRTRARCAAGRVRPQQLQAHQPPRPPSRARELAAEPVRPEGLGRRSRVGRHQGPRRRARRGARLRDHVATSRSHGRPGDGRVHQPRRSPPALRGRAPATATATASSTSATSARSPTATATVSPIPRI